MWVITMNDSKQRKLGAMLSYVSIVVNVVIQLLYTPILIKKMGSSEYGLFSLVSSIISYLTILDLGFGNAIIVYTAKYRAQKKYDEEKQLHGMFNIVFLIIGLITTICGLILAFNIKNIFYKTMTIEELNKAQIMMFILSFNLGVTFIFNIYSTIISAYEKFVFQKIVTIISTIIKPLIMIPLLFIGFKSITMTLIITVVNLLVLLSNYIFCRIKLNIKVKYRGFNKKVFKEICKYSFLIFLTVIVDKINWNVDQFILGAVSGTLAVSLYAAAAQINTMFGSLSTAISGILLPKVSKMIAKNASDEVLTSEFIRVGRIQYLIIFLMASGLVIFGKEFFVLWLGKEYITSYYISIILVLPLCIPLIQNLGISIMQAKNIHKFRSILYTVIAVINIIISIPLAKKYGGIGSAIGTSLSLIVGNILIMNIYYYKKVKINVIKFWYEIIKMTIPMAIPIIIIFCLNKIIVLNGLLHFIVFGTLYTTFYIIVCYLFSMNKYEKDLIAKIFKRRGIEHEQNN